ncbi:MAG: matrixin family metalloprotease [Myxococcales bacterium]|nr:matrixin family metalloprotease [Myxococcales bacterium]
MTRLKSLSLPFVALAFGLGLAACAADDEPVDAADAAEFAGDPELAPAADVEPADDRPDADPDDDAFVLDAAPGDEVEIAEGIAAVVPEPGDGVVMEVLYDDGAMYIADLATDEEGIVRLRLPGLGFSDGGVSHACASKCTDTSYKLLPHKWNQRINWYYRDANRPSSVGKTGTIDALKYAASTSTGSRNSCGMADQVSATHTYKGTTSTAPNISASGGVISCNTGDGKNVVGWATSFPSGTLGVACTWRSGGAATETDQKYNNQKSWFAGNSAPSGCSNRFSLRAVAAHEFGHSFGLDHSGCYQTMAPSTAPCASGGRMLGKGDVKGLRALY